jgi:hypothetical protein
LLDHVPGGLPKAAGGVKLHNQQLSPFLESVIHGFLQKVFLCWIYGALDAYNMHGKGIGSRKWCDWYQEDANNKKESAYH